MMRSMYKFSTFALAHGVFLKNTKLLFILGSFRKQLIGTKYPICSHPRFSTSSLSISSNRFPCNGLLGCSDIILPVFCSEFVSDHDHPIVFYDFPRILSKTLRTNKLLNRLQTPKYAYKFDLKTIYREK